MVFNNSGQGLQIGDVNGKDFILGTWPVYSDRRKQYKDPSLCVVDRTRKSKRQEYCPSSKATSPTLTLIP